MMFLMYLLQRLAERSTWLGLTAIVSGAGISVAPEMVTSISTFGMGFAGLISMLTKDKAE